jgi:hypothetical protein
VTFLANAQTKLVDAGTQAASVDTVVDGQLTLLGHRQIPLRISMQSHALVCTNKDTEDVLQEFEYHTLQVKKPSCC